MMIGPGSNFVLSQISLHLPLPHIMCHVPLDTNTTRHAEPECGTLDKLNSPGLLMCLGWTLYSAAVWLLYTDLGSLVTSTRIEGEMEAAYSAEPEVLPTQVGTPDPDLTERSPLLVYRKDDDLSSDIRAVDPRDLTSFNASPRISINNVPNRRSYGTPRRSYTTPYTPSMKIRRKSQECSIMDIPCRSWGASAAQRTIFLRSPRSRSHSTGSRKSNSFIDEAERFMGGESLSEVSDTDSQDSDSMSRIQEYPEVDIDNNIQLVNDPSIKSDAPVRVTAKDYLNVLLSDTVMCLIFLRFVALFIQTCLEAIAPPVMQTFFGYGDTANSVLYMLAGVQLFLVFLVLNIASRHLSDRVLISGGLGLMVAALAWLAATLPWFAHDDRSNVPQFAVGVILGLGGVPTVCDIGLSLYSKLLPASMQVSAYSSVNAVSVRAEV